MISQFHSVLTNALTPIILISGVGLMMLCMTNRYNHTTDRIRQLIQKRESTDISDEPDIDREIKLIFKRAFYLRRSMLSLSLSVVASGLLVATNVLTSFLSIELAELCAVWLVLALVLIVISSAFFCIEIGISLNALTLAVKHLKEEEGSCK